MLKKMTLEIDNFGAISHSIIDMNQINIVGGVNSSGKSTSSKLLYSFLISVSTKDSFLANKSINERFLPLMLILRNAFSDDSPNYLKLNSLINSIDSRDSKDIFNDFIEIYESMDFDARDNLSNDMEKIRKFIEINESEYKYAYIMNVLLNSEFKLNNVGDSKIRFYGNIANNSFDYHLNLRNNKLKGVLKEGSLNSLVFDEVIYLDSLSILDSYKNISSFDYSNIPFHIQDLLKELKSKGKLDVYGEFSKNTKIKEDLEYLIGGKIEFDSSMDEFIYKSNNESYSMTNTSFGIKQMGILQLLLEKNIIKNNSFVFMDEPEVNLHPEWQIKFAEFIVLLAKNSNICFYINSHSPFFIEAIEVYADFYNVLDKTSFYLSSKVGDRFNIERIDVEDLDIVYKNLGNPFNVLNRTRFFNEMRKESVL